MGSRKTAWKAAAPSHRPHSKAASLSASHLEKLSWHRGLSQHAKQTHEQASLGGGRGAICGWLVSWPVRLLRCGLWPVLRGLGRRSLFLRRLRLRLRLLSLLSLLQLLILLLILILLLLLSLLLAGRCRLQLLVAASWQAWRLGRLLPQRWRLRIRRWRQQNAGSGLRICSDAIHAVPPAAIPAAATR